MSHSAHALPRVTPTQLSRLRSSSILARSMWIASDSRRDAVFLATADIGRCQDGDSMDQHQALRAARFNSQVAARSGLGVNHRNSLACMNIGYAVSRFRVPHRTRGVRRIGHAGLRCCKGIRGFIHQRLASSRSALADAAILGRSAILSPTRRSCALAKHGCRNRARVFVTQASRVHPVALDSRVLAAMTRELGAVGENVGGLFLSSSALVPSRAIRIGRRT